MYLAGAGVGTLGIIDGDTVDISNLHRQIIHMSANAGINKAASAREQILQFNPGTKVNIYEEFLTPDNSASIIPLYYVILDASDNATARYLANDLAVWYSKPLVSGCALRWEG